MKTGTAKSTNPITPDEVSQIIYYTATGQPHRMYWSTDDGREAKRAEGQRSREIALWWAERLDVPMFHISNTDALRSMQIR